MPGPGSIQKDIKSEKETFGKAREFLRPGPFFRLCTYLYAERKLFVFFFVHFMCTMIVWCE